MKTVLFLTFLFWAVLPGGEATRPYLYASFSPKGELFDRSKIKQECEARIRSLTQLAGKDTGDFTNALSGEVRNNGIRIGGAELGLEGRYFDGETGMIVGVGGGIALTEKTFSFKGFPAGAYVITLSVEGHHLYDRRIRLPLDGKRDATLLIELNPKKEIAGRIVPRPERWINSGFLGREDSLILIAAVDKAGNFKGSIPDPMPGGLFINASFENPWIDKCEMPSYSVDYILPTNADLSAIKLPDLPKALAATGQLALSDGLKRFAGLERILENCLPRAVDSERRLVYHPRVDAQGRFVLVGLPEGKYLVDLDEFEAPPFWVKPQMIEVSKAGIATPDNIRLELLDEGQRIAK